MSPSLNQHLSITERKIFPLRISGAEQKEEKAKRIQEKKIAQKKGQSHKGDKNAGCDQSPEKRARQVESVADSVIAFFSQIKPVRNDKKSAAERAKEQKEKKRQKLGWGCLQSQLKKNQEDQKPGLDNNEMPERCVFDS